MSKRQSRSYTAFFVSLALTMAIPLGFIAAATWWIESRYGANVALMVWGGTLGVICFSLGAFLAHRIAKSTLNSGADFVHDLMQTEKQRQMSGRVQLQMERDQNRHMLRLEQMDMKRIDQLAQKRAQAMLPEMRQEAKGPEVPGWWDDEEEDVDADSFRYVE